MTRSPREVDDAENVQAQAHMSEPLKHDEHAGDANSGRSSASAGPFAVQTHDAATAGSRQGHVLFVANVYVHLVAFHRPFMELLQNRGYRVHAAASPAQGRKTVLQEMGVICHDTPFARTLITSRHGAALRKLRALMNEIRFDLIHVHTPAAAWLGRLAARCTHQGPVLYTAHGFHFYRGAPLLHWLLYYPAERLAARWTDGLLVMNEEDRSQAMRMGFREGENLFLVHGVGVDLQTYAPDDRAARGLRSSLALTERDFVVCCVAELTKNKNHAMLLAAWRRFAQTASSAHLLVIGDGALRQSLERTIVAKAIPRVHFLGHRENVPDLLAASDALVLSSRREGLPRSIMEAMAAGKPVVATDVRGSRDLVDHGSTGFLVREGDEIAMADAFQLLASDARLCGRMGSIGRDRMAPYSLEHVVDEMDLIYRRFLPAEG